jgi:protein-L-isoaspartate O-methyltransferase
MKLLRFLTYILKILNFRRFEYYNYLIYNFEKGFFKEIGWSDSLMNKIMPTDGNGNPIPMMSYSMIDFFKDRLKKDMVVFEYGSGNSTLFFSEYIEKIISVEHDEKWYNNLKSKIPENVELLYQKLEYDSDYCRKIHTRNEKFDLIIIDGRDRVNCLKNSFSSLKDNGVLVIDDMYREKYQEVIPFLKEKGFKHISFSGLSPGQLLHHKSVLFYKQNNIFGL